MTANVNLSSQPCQAHISGVIAPGISVSSCYGDMIDVGTYYVNGTASGTTTGNGVQFGNNNMQVALNGGETCSTCDPTNVPFGHYANTDGYLDPGDYAGTGPMIGSTSLPTAWSIGGGPDLSCCTFTDGCMDTCALNYNPAATLQSAQVCIYGINPWCSTNNNVAPPWNNVTGQYCCTPGGSQ